MSRKRRRRKDAEAPAEQGPPSRTDFKCQLCLSEAGFTAAYAPNGVEQLDEMGNLKTLYLCLYCLHMLQYVTGDSFHWAYLAPTFSPRDGAAAIREIEEALLGGRRDIPGTRGLGG